jgi:hypothetical protein
MGYDFVNVKLPNWNTLSTLQLRMKELMGLKVYNFVSPLGRPCSTLSIAEQLALVSPQFNVHIYCRLHMEWLIPSSMVFTVVESSQPQGGKPSPILSSSMFRWFGERL